MSIGQALLLAVTRPARRASPVQRDPGIRQDSLGGAGMVANRHCKN